MEFDRKLLNIKNELQKKMNTVEENQKVTNNTLKD